MGVTKSQTGLSDFHFFFQVSTIQLTSLPQKQGPSTRKTLQLGNPASHGDNGAPLQNLPVYTTFSPSDCPRNK